MNVSQRAYVAIVSKAADSLADDEYWCIVHPEGKPLENTASKDVTWPVRVLCQALEVDWDDLIDQGYRLATIRMA